MESLRTVGIGLIGAVFSASVLSMIIPGKSYEKTFQTVTGVYLIISLISLVSGVSAEKPILDFEASELTSYEKYGEELTQEYFINNIKGLITQKSGIEEDKINIELKVSEEKEITIERITVETESTKGLEKLSEMLECEIEVVN